MSREADWRPGEFAVLLSSPDLAPEELATDLPDRSTGAIEVVRQGVHLWHRHEDDRLILSRMMREYLSRRASHSHLACPVCREQF